MGIGTSTTRHIPDVAISVRGSGSTTSSLSGKKKPRPVDALVGAVTEMSSQFGTMFEKSTKTMEYIGSRIGYAHDLSAARRQVNDSLLQLPLIVEDRLKVGHIIVHDPEKIDFFSSLNENDALQYIYMLLSGKL